MGQLYVEFMFEGPDSEYHPVKSTNIERLTIPDDAYSFRFVRDEGKGKIPKDVSPLYVIGTEFASVEQMKKRYPGEVGEHTIRLAKEFNTNMLTRFYIPNGLGDGRYMIGALNEATILIDREKNVIWPRERKPDPFAKASPA